VSVLGMVEYTLIATGIRATDAMVKAAPVELLEARPITPGRYLALVTGDVASVEVSVGAGVAEAGAEAVLESFVLANLHEQVLPALHGRHAMPPNDALGVLETTSAAAIVEAADAACKAAPVRLMTLYLALHIGGKGYTVFAGDVADVEASVDAGARAAGRLLLDRVVIPNPYPELYEHLVRKPAW